MSNINAGIILSGMQPNIGNAMAQGREAGARANDINRQNALAKLYQEQGAQIVAGDQSALNALAQHSPDAALGVQDARLGQESTRLGMESTRLGMESTRQVMRISEQELAIAKEDAKRKAAAEAANLTAEQASAASERLESIISGASMAQDEQTYNNFLAQNGIDPAEYPFAQREIHLASVVGMKEAIDLRKSNNPSGPLVDMSGANFGTTEGGNVTDKFYEKLDTGQAEMFSTLLEVGMTAPSRLAMVDELEMLLDSAPSGAEAALKYAAGQFGINTEGLDELQAAQALISKLAPEQRKDGSGPMSDKDLAEFKKALPSLINQPGGNKIIAETMRGLIVYEMQQAEIANAVAAREITPAEGHKKLSELTNPLRWVREKGDTQIGKTVIIGENEIQKISSGGSE